MLDVATLVLLFVVCVMALATLRAVKKSLEERDVAFREMRKDFLAQKERVEEELKRAKERRIL